MRFGDGAATAGQFQEVGHGSTDGAELPSSSQFPERCEKPKRKKKRREYEAEYDYSQK